MSWHRGTGLLPPQRGRFNHIDNGSERAIGAAVSEIPRVVVTLDDTVGAFASTDHADYKPEIHA